MDVPPMSSTPFCMLSRSESAAKRCGSHESTAMFAITRGPSTKPVCAATKSSAPSLIERDPHEGVPDVEAADVQASAKRSKRTAFIVLFGSGSTCRSR